MPLPDLRWNLLRGFADDLHSPNDREAGLVIGLEGFNVEAAG